MIRGLTLIQIAIYDSFEQGSFREWAMNFDPESVFNWLHLMNQDYVFAFYAIVSAVVFTESALFFAFFLPGDSLLFFCGVAASSTQTSVLPLQILLILLTIVGYQINYELAHWINQSSRVKRFLRYKAALKDTRIFYGRYGFYAVVIARFVPVVRNFLPFVCGLAGMRRRDFILANIVGGIVWVVVIINLAYYFGQITWVREHLSWFFIMIVGVSSLPFVYKLSSFFWQKYIMPQQGAL